MKIYYSSSFAREYKKLISDVKKLAEKKEKIFRKNPFNPTLKTHKLTGKLCNYWSFSVDYHLRIVFRFITKDTVLFLDIGTHEIYR